MQAWLTKHVPSVTHFSSLFCSLVRKKEDFSQDSISYVWRSHTLGDFKYAKTEQICSCFPDCQFHIQKNFYQEAMMQRYKSWNCANCIKSNFKKGPLFYLSFRRSDLYNLPTEEIICYSTVNRWEPSAHINSLFKEIFFLKEQSKLIGRTSTFKKNLKGQWITIIFYCCYFN